MPSRKGTCQTCKGTTSSIQYSICRECRDKKTPDRKQYSRDWQLKKKYGLEIGEFEAWWISFRGKCGICLRELKRSEGKGNKTDSVVVDHDHSTGKIRGLLCAACNTGLGMFRDNIINLEKAIKWLKS